MRGKKGIYVKKETERKEDTAKGGRREVYNPPKQKKEGKVKKKK